MISKIRQWIAAFTINPAMIKGRDFLSSSSRGVSRGKEETNCCHVQTHEGTTVLYIQDGPAHIVRLGLAVWREQSPTTFDSQEKEKHPPLRNLFRGTQLLEVGNSRPGKRAVGSITNPRPAHKHNQKINDRRNVMMATPIPLTASK